MSAARQGRHPEHVLLGVVVARLQPVGCRPKTLVEVIQELLLGLFHFTEDPSSVARRAILDDEWMIEDHSRVPADSRANPPTTCIAHTDALATGFP